MRATCVLQDELNERKKLLPTEINWAHSYFMNRQIDNQLFI